MSDDVFVMTYPCYFPLTKEGNPELVQIDDALCVCLFTDSDLAQAMNLDKYGPRAGKGFRVYAPKNAKELIAFLKDGRASFENEGCRFIAIDVSRGKRPMYCGYADFLEDLEKTL